MIRTEIKVETMEKEIKRTQESVLQTVSEMKKGIANILEKVEKFGNNITNWMNEKSQVLEEKEGNTYFNY